jgi:hypothetical protein
MKGAAVVIRMESEPEAAQFGPLLSRDNCVLKDKNAEKDKTRTRRIFAVPAIT